MGEIRKVIVIQTAFLGDVILTLPLIQVLHKALSDVEVDVVATPAASGLFAQHPAIHEVLAYDKRGRDSGIRGFRRLRQAVVGRRYDVAVIPHRSLRSALLARTSGIPKRIGFDTSAGRWLFTDTVKYDSSRHEIERNLALVTGMGLMPPEHEAPTLHPSGEDKQVVDSLVEKVPAGHRASQVAIAPGTIWNTKRWLPERFAEVARTLLDEGHAVVLVGSEADRALCEEIKRSAARSEIINAAGCLSLLQSVELIRRSRVLLSNDSAPMHMAVAVRTPVVAIFGATVPAFGFAPYGKNDVVVETLGLACRPCSIHGGDKCPIRTFDCMNNITVDRVLNTIRSKLRMPT